uniref:RNase H domain-containing protein n=1 Tax=Strongyloides papillosus TaxID=174720 RepID=A0A0N5BU27_STREA
MDLPDLLKTLCQIKLFEDKDAASFQIYVLNRDYFKDFKFGTLTREIAVKKVLEDINIKITTQFQEFKLDGKHFSSTPKITKENRSFNPPTIHSDDVTTEIDKLGSTINNSDYSTLLSQVNFNGDKKPLPNNSIVALPQTNNYNPNDNSINILSVSTAQLPNIIFVNVESDNDIQKLKSNTDTAIDIFEVNSIFAYTYGLKIGEKIDVHKRKFPSNYKTSAAHFSAILSFLKQATIKSISNLNVFTDSDIVIKYFKSVAGVSNEVFNKSTEAAKRYFDEIQLKLKKIQTITIAYILNPKVKTLLDVCKQISLDLKNDFKNEKTNESELSLNVSMDNRQK